MFLFILFLLAGVAVNYFSPINLQQLNFSYVAIVILVIGLYASVYEIDTQIVKKHKHLLISAVTLGVFLKSILIGILLYIFTRNILSFLLGVVVAQIDPLSVSYLLRSKDGSFSSVGRTILRIWSSFDDPMTILLSLFLVAPLVLGTYHANAFAYLYELAANFVFAGVVFCITKILPTDYYKRILLVICLIVAVVYNLTLGIALIALFLRPSLNTIFSHAVTVAFYIGVFLLGITVSFTAGALFTGVLLGIFAFCSQTIATLLIARKLPKTDKLHLALAQYNGITAIGLGIFFQQYVPSITSIIAVAVIVINSVYYVMNHWGYRMLIPQNKH